MTPASCMEGRNPLASRRGLARCAYGEVRVGWRGCWERFRSWAWRSDMRWERLGGRVAKRTLDVSVATLSLMLLAPLFAVLALAIKWRDGGDVLFWQTRVGEGGRTFPFPKFRSMVIDAEQLKRRLLQENDHGDSITFKMRSDPRITPVGKLLRRFSLDELPQLWCVLLGQMSLVGPRPAVPSEVAHYSSNDRLRLRAKPGLTCIWQVSGRGELPFKRQMEMDLEYIQERSFWLDLKLLLQTVPAVVSGRGAY